ncbi:MAG: glycosyltransferase, partial [Actinomycetota bacterium]|nr:glycosyltransferase [Actinomycetota bacterium]
MTDSRTHNVLMIAYEFPPSAGGGVQRVMKLARYLPDNGWQPYVLCATPVRGTATDVGLLEQVRHVRARHLPDRDVASGVARAVAPFKRMLGRGRRAGSPSHGDPSAAVSAKAPFSTRVARSLFIDSAEPWSRLVPGAALAWARETQFDAVFASGPPHSGLVAGARVARLLGVPYIAELRDAWSGNEGYTWPDGHRQALRSKQFEREALLAAARVIAASEPISQYVRAVTGDDAVVVTNGFDPHDVPDWNPAPGPLRVAFMGRFYDTTDPSSFLDGVVQAIRAGGTASELRLDIVGPDSSTVRSQVSERGIDAHVSYHGFRPHDDALAIVSRADVGLVVLADRPGAEAIYTSKLFEYLGMGIPILLVGPQRGVAADLVREAHAGTVVP